MRGFGVLLGLIVVEVFGQQQSRGRRGCARTVVRPEIRDLSPQQLSIFLNATQVLHSRRNNFISKQSDIHLKSSSETHGAPAFLPWHREFLRRYEMALQEVNPSIILPYWDWSRDSQSPERSQVLSPRILGGNGSGEDGCVMDGPFSGWELQVPTPHCLRRDYDGGEEVSPFYAPEALEAIIEKSQTYHQFRERIEAAPHARVHASLGGKNGDIMTMYSPNDPIFYLHHAFIDLLWSEWQQRHPRAARTYDNAATGASVSPNDMLPVFNVAVGTVLDTSAMCYTYPRYGATLPTTNAFSRLKRRQLGRLLGVSNILHGAMESVDAAFNTLASATGISLLEGINLDFSALQPLESLDRTTRNKIRTTRPIPDEYLQMNNINIESARRIESELNTLAAACNALDDFVPMAHLL